MKPKNILLLGTAAVFATPVIADKAAVLDTCADIAQAKYSDSLTTTRALFSAVNTLTENPSAEALQTAKSAGAGGACAVPADRSVPFRQCNRRGLGRQGERLALGRWADRLWDAIYGRASDENDHAVLNVVAHPSFTLSGQTIDASAISPALLEGQLHEAEGGESNVATGYHAIEFLLWGEDLNGHGAGAGARSWTDYAMGATCIHDNCDRHGEYLTAATQLLVSDLAWVAEQWADGDAARVAVLEDEDAGIWTILTSTGLLSYGEQAGERMRLGVLLNDPEEEHNCFSDNTRNTHFYDASGICNVYLCSYTCIDCSVVSGPSLSSVVADADAAVDSELGAKLDATMLEMPEMNTAVEALIMGAVDALVDQRRSISRAMAIVSVAQIALEGSDSLDDLNPAFR